MYKLKVLHARTPMLLMYGLCFLLAQALLFCQHLKHILWWLPQKMPEDWLCLEEQAVCESHSFLQVRHLPQVCPVLHMPLFSCWWVRMPTT